MRLDGLAGARTRVHLVVEFRLLRVGDDPTGVVDAEVGVGLGQHRHAARRRRRNVRDHEIRIAGRIGAVGGEHGRTDAVGVLQMRIDPAGRRQVRGVQLARADQHGRELAVDEVAVDGERRERVVRANRLSACDGCQRDRLGRVPKADVVEGRRRGLHLGLGDRRRTREGMVGNVVEAERRSRRDDVSLDVRSFE